MAAKAKLKTARDEKLALYNKQKKWLTDNLDNVVGMAADAMSLMEDTMREATRFFKNARENWGEDFSKFPIVFILKFHLFSFLGSTDW
jgi:hypothetical protein